MTVPCEGKSAGKRKEIEEGRGRRNSACGQAMRSAARNRRSIKKKSGTHPMTESTGALWGKHSR